MVFLKCTSHHATQLVLEPTDGFPSGQSSNSWYYLPFIVWQLPSLVLPFTSPVFPLPYPIVLLSQSLPEHAMLSSVSAVSSFIFPTCLTQITPDQLLFIFKHSSQVSPAPGSHQWLAWFVLNATFLGYIPDGVVISTQCHQFYASLTTCLLYTSDAADETSTV